MGTLDGRDEGRDEGFDKGSPWGSAPGTGASAVGCCVGVEVRGGTAQVAMILRVFEVPRVQQYDRVE